jgi:hypothetical protein
MHTRFPLGSGGTRISAGRRSSTVSPVVQWLTSAMLTMPPGTARTNVVKPLSLER